MIYCAFFITLLHSTIVFNFFSHLIWSFDTDPVYFTVNSSQEYACLGEIYKMNCTSTASFNVCGISNPCWFKDGESIPCNCKVYNTQTRELSVHVPRNDSTAHTYACGAHRKPRPGCPHSNNFTVKPLSKLEGTAQCIYNSACTQCQGSI